MSTEHLWQRIRDMNEALEMMESQRKMIESDRAQLMTKVLDTLLQEEHNKNLGKLLVPGCTECDKQLIHKSN